MNPSGSAGARSSGASRTTPLVEVRQPPTGSRAAAGSTAHLRNAATASQRLLTTRRRPSRETAPSVETASTGACRHRALPDSSQWVNCRRLGKSSGLPGGACDQRAGRARPEPNPCTPIQMRALSPPLFLLPGRVNLAPSQDVPSMRSAEGLLTGVPGVSPPASATSIDRGPAPSPGAGSRRPVVAAAGADRAVDAKRRCPAPPRAWVRHV